MLVKNVTKTYKNGSFDKKALDNVSISFPDKGMFFVYGKSGSGKTTLLNILSGIERPTSGSIDVNGILLESIDDEQVLDYRNSYCGVVFQEYNLLDTLNVYDNVRLGLDLKGTECDKVSDCLKSVGLVNYEKKKIFECSGGEKQRVAIARTLIKEPKIILCDEPTGALDTENGLEVMKILKKLSKDRLIIVVSHDNELVEMFSDGTIELDNGKLTRSNLTSNNQSEKKIVLERSNMKMKRKIQLGLLGILKHPIRFSLNAFSIALSFLVLMFLIFVIGTNEKEVYMNMIKKRWF